MNRILILGQGDPRSYFSVFGNFIFENIPAKILLFADRKHLPYLKDLPKTVSIEVVRWSDSQEIIQKAQQEHVKSPFSGIVHWDERTVELAAKLRIILNLPSHSCENAEIFRDKIMMKNALGGIPELKIPKFINNATKTGMNSLLDEFGKLVCKPRKGYGSKGVSIFTSSADIDKWLAEEDSQADFECEEFIEGILYHINALVVGGEIRFQVVAPYLPGFANIDFSAGTPFVTQLETDAVLVKKLETVSRKIISKLNILNGVTHLECFVTAGGEIVLCEIATRPGGGGIVWLIELATGINVDHAMCLIEAKCEGFIPKSKIQVENETVCLIGMRSSKMGEIQSVPNLSLFSSLNAPIAKIYLKPGQFLLPSGHCTDFNALFIFKAESALEGLHKLQETRALYEKNLVLV